MDDWQPPVEMDVEGDPMPEGHRIVLGAIMEHGRKVADKTVERIATATGRSEADVRRWLEELEQEGLAERDQDAVLGIEFWRATAKAADLDFD